MDTAPHCSPVRRYGLLFAAGGSALAVLGLVPWLALLAGADGAAAVALLAIAALAVVGGGFVALVGIGLVRQDTVERRARAELVVDAAVLAVEKQANSADHADCGRQCTTCTAACALADLRS